MTEQEQREYFEAKRKVYEERRKFLANKREDYLARIKHLKIETIFNTSVFCATGALAVGAITGYFCDENEILKSVDLFTGIATSLVGSIWLRATINNAIDKITYKNQVERIETALDMPESVYPEISDEDVIEFELDEGLHR